MSDVKDVEMNLLIKRFEIKRWKWVGMNRERIEVCQADPSPFQYPFVVIHLINPDPKNPEN